MNHMAITWWARDTMYWLNLVDIRATCPTVLQRINQFKAEDLLGGIRVGQGDGKHADVLLSYKVSIEMWQPHQS